jgi:hypothetical protein
MICWQLVPELVSPCKYAVVSAADFASALLKPAVQPGNLAKSLQVSGNYAEQSRLCYTDWQSAQVLFEQGTIKTVLYGLAKCPGIV